MGPVKQSLFKGSPVVSSARPNNPDAGVGVKQVLPHAHILANPARETKAMRHVHLNKNLEVYI
jgi:hypothetical protein